MTTKEVRKVLRESGGFDSISEKDGVFTVRRGFFYKHGGTSQKLVDAVKKALPSLGIEVQDQGEVWKPFRGGASVASNSHWFVKFAVPNLEEVRA